MADKKNLCAQIDTALHARVRQEQEQSGQTLSEFVEQLITDYYKMKEGTKMTGDTPARSPSDARAGVRAARQNVLHDGRRAEP